MFVSMLADNNWDLLQDTLRLGGKDHWQLNKNEISDLVSFVNIFNRATKGMETTSRPTLHNVLAWYGAIEKHLQMTGNESAIVKEAKKNVESYFLLTKLEFGEYLNSNYHKMSVYLHPAMKQMPKFLPNDQELIRQEVSFFSCLAKMCEF